jgi:hypothetical protein
MFWVGKLSFAGFGFKHWLVRPTNVLGCEALAIIVLLYL